jgi:hypothetical protein
VEIGFQFIEDAGLTGCLFGVVLAMGRVVFHNKRESKQDVLLGKNFLVAEGTKIIFRFLFGFNKVFITNISFYGCLIKRPLLETSPPTVDARDLYKCPLSICLLHQCNFTLCKVSKDTVETRSTISFVEFKCLGIYHRRLTIEACSLFKSTLQF